MNDKGDLSDIGRKTKRKNTLSTRPNAQSSEWEYMDDQLDDALRQTFPASDALSIIQTVRRR
jgi:hypothetical protein